MCLNRELKERTAAQHAEEERRKTLETKMVAAEEHLAQTKVSPDLFPVISSLWGGCGLCTMIILGRNFTIYAIFKSNSCLSL